MNLSEDVHIYDTGREVVALFEEPLIQFLFTREEVQRIRTVKARNQAEYCSYLYSRLPAIWK